MSGRTDASDERSDSSTVLSGYPLPTTHYPALSIRHTMAGSTSWPLVAQSGGITDPQHSSVLLSITAPANQSGNPEHRWAAHPVAHLASVPCDPEVAWRELDCRPVAGPEPHPEAVVQEVPLREAEAGLGAWQGRENDPDGGHAIEDNTHTASEWVGE